MGRNIFSDTHLSFNNTKSCASCHSPKLAFTDGYRTSITSFGEHLDKNSPTLLYLKNNHFFNHSDPKITTLDHQHRKPLFSKEPIELGTDSIAFLKYINSSPRYQNVLSKYTINSVSSMSDVIDYLATYVESLSLYRSPYDNFLRGDSSSLNEMQQNGMHLFMSPRLHCINCHTPPNFTNVNLTTDINKVYPNSHWSNKANSTNVKVPTLRNIAVTGPYLHNGTLNTMSEVIDKYDNWFRSANSSYKPLNKLEKTE
ncbi:MAG: cytochrome-c peroxidase, partial [Bacteroidia bacterium]